MWSRVRDHVAWKEQVKMLTPNWRKSSLTVFCPIDSGLQEHDGSASPSRSTLTVRTAGIRWLSDTAEPGSEVKPSAATKMVRSLSCRATRV